MLPIDPIVRTVVNTMRTRGGDATLVLPDGEPVYNPATSTATSPETSYTIRVLVFDYIQKNMGMNTDAGGLIQSGDKQMFVQPQSTLPKMRPRVGHVLYQGMKFDIITAKEVNPSGGNVILHELFIRA